MIRLATPSDAAAVARVHVETWRAAYAGLVPDAVLAALSVPANAARWAGLLADGERRVWVHGDPVDGFLAAGPARDADLPAAHGEVYAAYVHPGAQRAGTGRALLGAAVTWFASEAWPAAALWVLRANVAGRAFYEACGWAPDGSAREADIGGAVVAEVRYRARITPGSATWNEFAR